MEKRYGVVVAIGSFVILFSLIVFLIIYTGSTDICTDRECVKVANELLTHMDPSISPCSDFYEFSCGGFLKASSELEFKSVIDNTRNAKTHKIRQMIEDPVGIHDNKVLFKIKTFYRACINETAINKAGLKGIKSILAGIGGWPVLERGNWRENDFDWRNTTHYLRNIGIDFNLFFRINIGVNVYDGTRKIIEIRHGSIEYINIADSQKIHYHEYLVNIANYFGADRNRAEHASKEVIEFQSQLKQIITDEIARGSKIRDPYNQRILSLVQNDFPDIPWVDYINGVLYPTASVTSDETVNIADPEYIRNFLELLRKTPKRILANFISWYAIHLNIQNLPEDLRKIEEVYQQKTVMQRRKSRREVCANLVQAKLPDGIQNSYVRKFVSDTAKRVIKGIIDYIKKELNKIIDDLDWLDGDAKEVAREKLASIKDYIAHTPEAPSRRKLDLIYDEVRINQANFLASVLNVDLLNLNHKYQELIEPVYENEKADEVIYSIKQNTILLPSYYLQGLFFDENRPQYMNYGAIGTIIAYQLSNLLLEGKRYDLYGNLREWSTSQSLLNYDNRTKCISEQYKEFYVPGLGRNVNSSSTLEDDTAVYLGKKIAYKAYYLWSKSHDNEHRLPGLNYTPQQLFWISSAIHECSDITQENITKRELNDIQRSIPRYRVIGPLRNIEEFSKDFNCRTDSFMHPNEKCLLL